MQLCNGAVMSYVISLLLPAVKVNTVGVPTAKLGISTMDELIFTQQIRNHC